MTHPTSPRPALLPIVDAGVRHGNRSLATCYYRCGNACDHPIPNTTDNPHVSAEVARSVGRRSVLGGAAAGGAMLVLGGLAGTAPAAAAPPKGGRGPARGEGSIGTVEFIPVEPNVRDAVTVPGGFASSLVIAWGDPVVKGAPAFDAHAQTPESARAQFGYNADYVGVLPLPNGNALLVVNHEYTNEQTMFPAGEYSDDEIRRIAMASHGMSIVEIERGSRDGSWQRVSNLRRARFNRRIHSETEFVLDGPAAGDDRLKTSADPTGSTVLGTFNNCAGGATPWGTVLSGEENFNQYFGSTTGSLPAEYAEEYARYGINAGLGRGWALTEPRFDLSGEPHEPHRFGWVVEIDPYEPASTPVKHTMLGRFKHEGANVIVSDSGHAVAYMGDDERGDYLYKFVSRDTVVPGDSRPAREHNKQLLSAGTLYVARLTGDGLDDGEYDGTGEWIRLCTESESSVPGMSVADVLLFTRLAADKTEPTKMDRPEDVEPNPVNGRIYAALTNNTQRGSAWETDEANPLDSSMTRSEIGAPLTESSGNRNGYVLELTEDGADHTGIRCTWNLFLVCGDPEAQETYFGGYDKSQVSPISCPDNVAFDADGNLWVSTDGNNLGSNDGLFRVPVDGPERGRLQQFATVPRRAECCGPFIYENRSVFLAPQHPGDDGTFGDPTSTWPHTHDFPRPGVVVAYQA